MTARVLSLHGIAPNPDRRTFAFRNLLASEALRRFLRSARPSAPLSDALAGRGTALTIDDATRAAADAALLARELGHPVTLFINPAQIESGAPYHFLLLNALLDRLSGGRCEFAGQRFETATLRHRQVLRQVIKKSLRVLTSEQQRVAFVDTLARRWNVDALEVPAHFQTLTRAELQTLIVAGVDIQNHGWSHSHHATLTAAESAREVELGREWIRKELGTEAPWFAAPFGDGLPHDHTPACEAWLTVSDEWKEGWIGRAVFNRRDLLLSDEGVELKPSAPPSLLRRWSRLLPA